MLAYLLLQLAAMENVVSSAAEIICWDSSIAARVEKCPPTPVLTITVPSSPSLAARPIPKSNPGSWINMYDYPNRSIQDEAEGITGFHLTIGIDGLVSSCEIMQSSGDPALDLATCSNITRRARFQPALDDAGNPTTGIYNNRVKWQIPEDPSYAIQIDTLNTSPHLSGGYNIYLNREYPAFARALRQGGEVTVAVDVSDMGRARACTVTQSSGFAALDAQSCNIAKKWTNYMPANDEAGKPISGQAKHQFFWIAPKVYDANGHPLPLAVPLHK
jgi:TonB family protein